MSASKKFTEVRKKQKNVQKTKKEVWKLIRVYNKLPMMQSCSPKFWKIHKTFKIEF